MANGSLRQSGLPSVDYYAPNYRIEVEGRELDPQSKGDVLDVKVSMDMENMTRFDLTVNNWDARNFTFKYSDTKEFDVGNRVHIQMGYADKLLSMMRGQISSLTPKFPSPARPPFPSAASTVCSGCATASRPPARKSTSIWPTTKLRSAWRPATRSSAKSPPRAKNTTS